MTGPDLTHAGMTRRRLLQGAAAAGLVAGGSGLLAACGGQGTAGSSPAASGGKPKRGGRLRVGHVGGGKGESFDPGLSSNIIGASRMLNVYDPLVRINPDLSTAPGLALEWKPNADATVWEIALRPDVTFHDGKSLTADDVIYTMRTMADPQHAGSPFVTNIRLDELKAVNPLTVRVPLKAPSARLFDSFNNVNSVILPDGGTPFTKPVGTGPFQVTSFDVGERSVAKRNPSYWEEGKPYVDEWEDISIADDAARLNALLSGEIDAMTQIPLAQAKAQKAQGALQIVQASSPSPQVFVMAVDEEPFNDQRVREAFRLIADREALIEAALNGFGTAANDLVGAGLPYFADDLPQRQQDLEQARSLLKAAGREDLRVTLHTSTIVPGFVESATLFAEQAKGAGVTVDVKREPANAYFDISLLYTHIPFGQSYWVATSLSAWYEQALMSDAAWNETHWRDKGYDALIRQAQGATSEAEAAELWHQVQQIQYDDGGYLVWANLDLVDAAANNVRGIVPSSYYYLGGFTYRDFWFA